MAGEHDRQEVEALTKKRPFVLNNNPFYPLKIHLRCQHEVILSLLFKYVLVWKKSYSYNILIKEKVLNKMMVVV